MPETRPPNPLEPESSVGPDPPATPNEYQALGEPEPAPQAVNPALSAEAPPRERAAQLAKTARSLQELLRGLVQRLPEQTPSNGEQVKKFKADLKSFYDEHLKDYLTSLTTELEALQASGVEGSEDDSLEGARVSQQPIADLYMLRLHISELQGARMALDQIPDDITPGDEAALLSEPIDLPAGGGKLAPDKFFDALDRARRPAEAYGDDANPLLAAQVLLVRLAERLRTRGREIESCAAYFEDLTAKRS
jgi:hypothetical protein